MKCSTIRSSFATTYKEGLEDKEEALEKAKKQTKDENIEHAARKMLWGYVGEQWLPLTIGMPFMFLSSIIDLIAPNYTGKIID